MSAISELIFKGAFHKVTSPFGPRKVMSTSAGSTNSYHYGTDYGTNAKKIAQYAIEDGTVLSAGKSSDGAIFAWIIYPRIKKAFLHYHLDSVKCKAGQSVKRGTLIGYTGATGKATGIHLHLGVRDLSSLSDESISKITQSKLNTCPYVDPEKVKYTEPTEKDKNSYLPARGYFKKGDKDEKISKIASFMYKTFPSYTDKKALGTTFGPYLLASIKEFQKRVGLESDGLIGPKTLNKLEHFGFKK